MTVSSTPTIDFEAISGPAEAIDIDQSADHGPVDTASVFLFFTLPWEAVDLSSYDAGLVRAVRSVRAESAVEPDTPVLMDEHFRPIEPWTSYFALLADSVGPTTLRNYAYDARIFESFLRGRGGSVLSAQQKDLVAYKRYRLEGCARPASAATYKRELVTIHGIYHYCVKIGLLKRLPWIKVGKKSPLDGPKPGTDPRVRCLTRDQWLTFRNVGLAGQLPDGRSDLSFRGEHPMRNSAAAELALGSGMRISEFTSVLDTEIPRHRPSETATLEIQAIAKYQISRTVDISSEARRSIDLYRATERRRIVRHSAKRLEKSIDSLFLVDKIDPIQLRVSGTFDGEKRSWSISGLPTQLRRIAVTEGEFGIEPLALFLGGAGLPPRLRTWSSVFQAANQRLSTFQHVEGMPTLPPRVLAHDLRHTYAVVLLRHLTMVAAEMEASRRAGRLGHGSISDHLVWNPLLRLQERMGHARLQTTMKYLKHVSDSSEIVRAAMETWLDADKSYADYISEMFRQDARA